MAAALFRHKLQVLIALYLYAVGYIIKPPGSLLECLGRLAGLEPLVMDWIGQTARDAVNGPVELVVSKCSITLAFLRSGFLRFPF